MATQDGVTFFCSITCKSGNVPFCQRPPHESSLKWKQKERRNCGPNDALLQQIHGIQKNINLWYQFFAFTNIGGET